MKQIRYLEVTPNVLIDFMKGDLTGQGPKITFQIIANGLPPDAELVGIEYNSWRETQFLKIQSDHFTDGPLYLKPVVVKRFFEDERQNLSPTEISDQPPLVDHP